MSSKFAASGPPASLRSMTPFPFVSRSLARPPSGGVCAVAAGFGVGAAAVFGHSCPVKKPRISAPSRVPDLLQSMSSKFAASGPPASLRSMTPFPFVSRSLARLESAVSWAAAKPVAASSRIMAQKTARLEPVVRPRHPAMGFRVGIGPPCCPSDRRPGTVADARCAVALSGCRASPDACNVSFICDIPVTGTSDLPCCAHADVLRTRGCPIPILRFLPGAMRSGCRGRVAGMHYGPGQLDQREPLSGNATDIVCHGRGEAAVLRAPPSLVIRCRSRHLTRL